MTWADHRKFVLVGSMIAIFVAIIAVTLIATLHHTPSCTDGIQNADEVGIDCGGLSCAYLCTSEERAPVTLFARAIVSEPGRTDVVALVQNKNATAAAKNVPYQISLYGDDGSLLKAIPGSLDLPPSVKSEGQVAVFVAGALTTGAHVASASLAFDPMRILWYRLEADPRTVPSTGNYLLSATDTAPRLTAVLTNKTAEVLRNIKTIAIIYDENGNVQSASQTIVPQIAPNDTAVATFTWNNPFPHTAGRIEVVPVVPLP